jgi:thioredoxin-like negative regulator of GroEL
LVNLQIGAAIRNLKSRQGHRRVHVLLSAEPDNQHAILGVALTNMEKGDVQAAEQTLTQAAAALSQPQVFDAELKAEVIGDVGCIEGG